MNLTFADDGAAKDTSTMLHFNEDELRLCVDFENAAPGWYADRLYLPVLHILRLQASDVLRASELFFIFASDPDSVGLCTSKGVEHNRHIQEARCREQSADWSVPLAGLVYAMPTLSPGAEESHRQIVMEKGHGVACRVNLVVRAKPRQSPHRAADLECMVLARATHSWQTPNSS